MRLFNYIKKYSDFYLSKYSVTKRKFEDILKQKLKKDFFKKKISVKDYEMFLEQIKEIVDHYDEIGIFNEELIIKNKIQHYLRKGYSLKKIESYLIKSKFKEELINGEITNLNKDNSLKEALVERFIEKKIKLSRYKDGQLSKNQVFDRLIRSLVQNGFDYEYSKNILNRYLSKC
jgi:SOS response regulatory protein OraA/RecX